MSAGSVTRCRDYFQSLVICVGEKLLGSVKICQSRFNLFCQIPKSFKMAKDYEILQAWLNFAKSGHTFNVSRHQNGAKTLALVDEKIVDQFPAFSS